MIRRMVAALALVTALCGAGDQPYQSSPPRRTVTETRDWGPWAGPFRAGLVPGLMRDFGERNIYAAANAALPAPAAGEQRVVFIGDSITDGWDLSRSFPGRPFVNRGIGSQVTAQMLVRFEQDVVALRPAAVVILAGINDVAGFLQMETPDGIVANIGAMGDLAEAHGIRVVLSSILPVNNYTASAATMLDERPPATLAAINARLRSLATCRGYAYADYAAVTADRRGLLEAMLTLDGLHPNATGYARMAPVAVAAVDRALAAPVSSRAERTCPVA